MSGQGHEITVNSRNYDRSIRRSWKCKLIDRNDPLLVFVGEFEEDVTHPELGLIQSGTISYEYFWLDRWYNVFRFQAPGGVFRNFYCNVTMPPTFTDGVIDYIDMDIDVVVWTDRSYKVLDLDDFEVSSAKFAFPDSIVSKSKKALDELIGMIAASEFPFAI
jgi:protein associated with RNAse G/E